MITNFKDLYVKNLVLSCDTECFPDYWNFIFKRIGEDLTTDFSKIPQIRYNPKTKVYIFECFNDEDCQAFNSFYKKFVLKNNAIMYFYNSTGYDKPMINILLNLVSNKKTNILPKLRKANDYIIKYKINYKLYSQKYWENFFKDDRKYIDEKELFESLGKEVYQKFYNDFKGCTANKVTKLFDEDLRRSVHVSSVLDIQVIGGFQPGQTKDGEGSSMSLKQLQLVHLGQNQKFDFNKYSTMEEIKAEGLYDTFISYSENDVVSLEFMYFEYAEKDVKNRFYAIKAVKDEGLKDDLEYESHIIFSEKNTALIELLCAIDKQKEFKIDYKDYIQTGIKEFDDFVDFVNRNQGTKDDTTLKRKYKEKTGEEVAVFELNGSEVVGGYGGAHGAISKYKNFKGNLYQLDYASQYPSIILEYKEIFRNIMNVDLYEAVYNLRLKYKALKKKAEKEGNDDLAKEYDNIQNGLKLILNSTYGLINSAYKIKLANKILGRFVCLKGQSLLYNLCKRNPDKLAPNINTDGVYLELDSFEEGQAIAAADYEANGKGYFKLDVDPVDWIIQNDVNNYMLVLKSGKTKQKGGAFNLGIKQKFNKHSNIDVNINNALNLLSGKEVEIKEVYFKGMSNIDCDKSHYFTTPEKGINPVNNLKYPTKLSIDKVDIYVTQNKDDADINVYKEYAELTKGKIEAFNNKVTNNKYFEHIITSDTNENNKILTSNINRVKKLLDIDIKDIGYCGFLGIAKNTTFLRGKPINQLINYKKTEIKNSVESQGIKVYAPEKIIIVDVDIFDKHTKTFKHGYPEKLVDTLSKVDTYKTWNSATKDYKNFKLIFKNDINQILDIDSQYKGYIEVIEESTVWTMEGLDRQYFDNNMPVANISDYADLFKGVLTVKHEDAKKHIEDKEEREKNQVLNNNDTESNDIVINTAINVLRNENVDIFNVVLDEKGTHIHTSCPYCNNINNRHYKDNYNTIDAYVNINENNGNYNLNVFSLSDTCKGDKSHKEYFKELNEKFKNELPNKEEIENLKLVEDLRENVDMSIVFDKDFFIKDTVKIVGTGGGKTFQSAAKLAYNILHNKVFTIVTTKQNSNIEDFERTFKKVIKLSLKRSTKRIDEWLETDSKGFHNVFIHKLKNVNPIRKETLEKLNGVVTNHKYFYNNGHMAEYNNNMIQVREQFEKGPMEIIVDEYESFKEMGVMTIPMNEYLNYKLDIDTNEKIFIKANSCFYPCIKKLIKPEHTYQYAKENINQSVNENEGINEYGLEATGDKDLYTQFNKYCDPVGIIKYDCGRRKPQKIHKDTTLSYIVCDKIQQYKVKDNIPEDGLKNNFKELLLKNEYIALVTQVIKVSTEYVEDFDVNIWGRELGSIEELTNFCKHSPDLSENDFNNFKARLYQDAKECYINYLALSIKSILDSFDCPKYYLTANVIRDNKLSIDTTLAYQSSKSIKKIDVAVIDRNKNNDTAIIDNLDLLENMDFKTLAFVSLAKHLKTIINQKTEINTSHIVIKSVVNDGEKSVNVDTRQAEDIDDNITKTTTLAYINGTESQGRNYSKSELLIINGVVDINVKGRLTVNEKNEIIIKSIEEAAAEKLRQAFGRIFRGDQQYKSMLILGEYAVISEIIHGYGEKYSIQFELHKYNKTIDRKAQLRRGMADIIEYFGSKFAELNDPTREQREIEYFNADLRKKANAKKYDGEEVFKYYLSLVDQYYKDHGKKPKDKDLIPFITEKYGMKEAQFKRIKKKYKS